jgi:phosphatidylglycerophosphatase A
MPKVPFAPSSPAWWIASGLGSGLSPVAPGTAGSLVGLLLAWALGSPGHSLVVGSLVAAVGIPATAAAAGIGFVTAPDGPAGDPGWVVVDEVAGQLIACAAIPAGGGPAWYLAAFVAFRLLDIRKPGIVGVVDRLPGAVAVMFDDVLAGALAALLLAIASIAMAAAPAGFTPVSSDCNVPQPWCPGHETHTMG